MRNDVLSRPLDALGAFRLPLTRPRFANFPVIAVGWIQSHGAHAVTEALVVSGVAGTGTTRRSKAAGKMIA